MDKGGELKIHCFGIAGSNPALCTAQVPELDKGGELKIHCFGFAGSNPVLCMSFFFVVHVYYWCGPLPLPLPDHEEESQMRSHCSMCGAESVVS